MSWTDVFPVLTDEDVAFFESHSTPEWRADYEGWFAVEREINRKTNPSHLVSTSLFWRRDLSLQGVPDPVDRESFRRVEWRAFWNSYMAPLVSGAKLLSKEMPEAAFRVYLANEIGFLADNLVKAGCEVYLMNGSSVGHNPGAMWRFLAFENATCPVINIDADRAPLILSDIARTEAALRVGVGAWRVPYDFSGPKEGYRPINASQFGSLKSYPTGKLMEAFIWHNLVGRFPTTFTLEGLREDKIAGTQWPEYGFDEWFLLSVMYPRMAMEGLLTFVPWDLPSLGQFFALDIEYSTWANPNSELINYPNPESELGDVIRPWAEWKDKTKLEVRPETFVVERPRKRIGPFHSIFHHAERNGEETRPLFLGELSSFLAGASANVTERWFVDLNPQVHLSANGGELFLDRRYDGCDVVFCGCYFIKITSEIAEWARGHGLDPQVWGEGRILKVPKLEGPMTLWSTKFSRMFYEEQVSQVPFVRAEILLRAWMDQGKVRIAETTAKQMGWQVR